MITFMVNPDISSLHTGKLKDINLLSPKSLHKYLSLPLPHSPCSPTSLTLLLRSPLQCLADRFQESRSLCRCISPWKIREKGSIQLCSPFVERVNNLLRPKDSQIVYFTDNASCLVPSQYEFQLRSHWIQFSPSFPGWTENSALEDETGKRWAESAQGTLRSCLCLPLRALQVMPKRSSKKETLKKVSG